MAEKLPSHDLILTTGILQQRDGFRSNQNRCLFSQGIGLEIARPLEITQRTAQATLAGVIPDRQNIALKNKAAHKGSGRRVHHVFRAGALMQTAVTQHSHSTADRQRLLGVMGHQNSAGVAGTENRWQFTAKAQANLHIKIREGLIKQDHRRRRCQGSGQSKTLTLTT